MKPQDFTEKEYTTEAQRHREKREITLCPLRLSVSVVRNSCVNLV